MQSHSWYRRFIHPVFSVAWRDIRITTRYKSWFVASFIWPIIFPFSLIFLGQGLAGPDGEGVESFTALAGTSDYSSFLIVGSLVWMFVNINLWMGGLSLMTDRTRGTFDTHWTMPVSKLALVVGATLASLALNFVPMVVAIGFYAAIGWLEMTGSIVQVILAILTVVPFLLGFLLCFAALTVRFREAGILVQVLRTVFSILCGLQFPLAVLPPVLQSIGAAIPLTHFIDLVRTIVIHGGAVFDHAASVAYLLGSGIALSALGAIAFELVRRSVRSSGLVTGY
ncbi:MAG: ABC transporter permease [Spirochaetaceae bacterium]|nr:MAG: ABC transporter permease [Spirochaetaceae bacterium]